MEWCITPQQKPPNKMKQKVRLKEKEWYDWIEVSSLSIFDGSILCKFAWFWKLPEVESYQYSMWNHIPPNFRDDGM